jgi:hypothetical protein
MARMYRRPGGLAVLVAAAAIGLAACSSGSSSPQVASLGTTSSGNGSGSSTGSGNGSGSSTTGLKDTPAQLLSEWTACMRSHGDPNQADPTIDINKVIHIAAPAGYTGLLGFGGKTGTNSCSPYLNAASAALEVGYTFPAVKANVAQAEKFSQCMRANGVSDFPDPTGNSLHINRGAGGDLNPSNPVFEKANKLCAKRVGVQGFGGQGGAPQPGSVEADG